MGDEYGPLSRDQEFLKELRSDLPPQQHQRRRGGVSKPAQADDELGDAMLSPGQPWATGVTALEVVLRGLQWLMLRHERHGVVSWEIPGGHLEVGESLEEAAARETSEEAGVDIAVGSLVATCVHEWT